MNSQYQREKAREHCIKMNTTHGKSYTRLFRIYSSMKQRCYCKSAKDYHNYGLRGIRVCDEWKSDFMSFYNWAMSNGYSEELSIDRIDNNGDYEPSNCRWATVKEQARNRRTNKNTSINGITKTAIEWAEISGIKKETLMSRLRYGWSGEKLLSMPRMK